jgi:squalene synthase HpnC
MKLVKANELCNLTTSTGGIFQVNSFERAYQFCKNVTLSHYENFPVGSLIIPKKYRKHFYSVYAFSRIADDIADESNDNPSARIQYLNDLAEMINQIDKFANNPNEQKKIITAFSNPIILALSQTMAEKNIASEPFLKLLKAFKRDILFEQPKDFAAIEDYCMFSANPIGEIILGIFGLYNDITKQFSDSVCTGLQMVNFWQDLSIDLQKGRCYLPHDFLQKYILTKENLHHTENSVKLSQILNEIYDYTYSFFIKGRNLVKYLTGFRLKFEIRATLNGGELMLDKLIKLNTGILNHRPYHRKFDIIKILFKSLI